MDDQTPNTLQTQVTDLTSRVDDLEFIFSKKTGPSSNAITGSVLNSVNFKSGSSGWQLTPDGNLEANNGNFRGDITGARGTFSGTVTVGSLNIPDSTSANSMHVDTAGNTWWGSNISTGLSGAMAYVKNDGTALFKDVQVGGQTYQYTMNDTGIYTFCDGSDGIVHLTTGTPSYPFGTWSGANFTLTRDVFATSILVDNSIFIFMNGYRIFAQDHITLASGANIIVDGNAASGQTGGAALTGNYLSGGLAGANGPSGGVGGTTSAGSPGTNGSAATGPANSLGIQGGGASGRGGDGGGAAGGSGGAHGTAATSAVTSLRNIKPIILFHFTTMLDINADGTFSKYGSTIPGASGGSGGGGAGPGFTFGSIGGTGGYGGAGGGAAGIAFIAARTINLNAGCNIFARGGAGANGENGHNGTDQAPNHGQAGGGGGGGGGAGGNGGIVFLIYNVLNNLGSITVTGGAGGTAGAGGAQVNGGAGGAAGADGASGGDGRLISISMSL